MKVFIKTPLEKELPNESGWYICTIRRKGRKPTGEYHKELRTCLCFLKSDGKFRKEKGFSVIAYWKEIDLSELMEEMHCYWMDEDFPEHYTYNDVVNKFLTEKGYIQL